MIKKLSKYGNSHAIVLDKALLELLEITDTTKLKLTTDGKSLTITPLAADVSADLPVFISDCESPGWINNNQVKSRKQSLEMIANITPEAMKALQIEGAEINERFNKKYDYQNRFQALQNNPEYQVEFNKLNKQALDKEFTPEQFHAAYSNLTKKYDPELVEIQKEVSAEYARIGEKYMPTTKEANEKEPVKIK